MEEKVNSAVLLRRKPSSLYQRVQSDLQFVEMTNATAFSEHAIDSPIPEKVLV